jgi:hypothetical protein
VLHPLAHRVAGRVAPDREHVADTGTGEAADDVAQLGDGVVDGGEVRHRQQGGLGGDPFGHRDGGVPGGAAGTVRDRHEGGPQRLQLTDRLPEQALTVGGLGWEELEGERGLGTANELTDRR